MGLFFSDESSWTVYFTLMFVLIKGLFNATVIVYPSYKSYKALESGSLKQSQAMLLYWACTAFINGVKEVCDQLLGTFSNFLVWKSIVLLLKATPLLIGPDRMYNYLVKPLYSAQEENIEAVANEVREIGEVAKSAVREGDIKEGGSEIMDRLKQDSQQLASNVQQKTGEIVNTLQANKKKWMKAYNLKGVEGVMEQMVVYVEIIRDWVVDKLDIFWARYGPTIRHRASIIQANAINLYQTQKPIIKQKATTLYTTKLQPRIEPIVTKSIDTWNSQSANLVNTWQVRGEPLRRNFWLTVDTTRGIWARYGGPVRTVYRKQLYPLWVRTLQPFYLANIHPYVADGWNYVLDKLQRYWNGDEKIVLPILEKEEQLAHVIARKLGVEPEVDEMKSKKVGESKRGDVSERKSMKHVEGLADEDMEGVEQIFGDIADTASQKLKSVAHSVEKKATDVSKHLHDEGLGDEDVEGVSGIFGGEGGFESETGSDIGATESTGLKKRRKHKHKRRGSIAGHSDIESEHASVSADEDSGAGVQKTKQVWVPKEEHHGAVEQQKEQSHDVHVGKKSDQSKLSPQLNTKDEASNEWNSEKQQAWQNESRSREVQI